MAYEWRNETILIFLSHQYGNYRSERDGKVLYIDGVSTGLGYYQENNRYVIPIHLTSGRRMDMLDENSHWYTREVTEQWLLAIAPLTDWTQPVDPIRKVIKNEIVFHCTRTLLHTIIVNIALAKIEENNEKERSST